MIQLDPGYDLIPEFEDIIFENNIGDIGPGLRYLGDNEDYFKNLNE